MEPDINIPLTESAPTSLLRKAKRWITIIIGMTVLSMGIALIVLPGPAIVVIPLGLAILATELVWAKRLLHKVKEKFAGKQEEERK